MARDCNGVCRGAGTTIGRSNSVIYAEEVGFQLATKLSLWLNLTNIIIEGDNQIVVKSLKGRIAKDPLENLKAER